MTQVAYLNLQGRPEIWFSDQVVVTVHKLCQFADIAETRAKNQVSLDMQRLKFATSPRQDVKLKTQALVAPQYLPTHGNVKHSYNFPTGCCPMMFCRLKEMVQEGFTLGSNALATGGCLLSERRVQLLHGMNCSIHLTIPKSA